MSIGEIKIFALNLKEAKLYRSNFPFKNDSKISIKKSLKINLSYYVKR